MHPIEVRALRKEFGPVHALKDITFSVARGEIFGYLGPNGAGKTTTLRSILGLVRPTGGEVRLFGADPRRADTREMLGYLPGEFHLYGDAAAGAVLDYLARFRPHRPPILRDRLTRALEITPADLDRKIKFLSHGTRQKVGLIAAMQHDPDLLVLDEPSLGLDPLVQQSLRGLILDFASRDRAVLLSSHVLSEAEAMCHRVGLLREGELVAVESIKDLRAAMVRRLQVRFRGAIPQDIGTTKGVTQVRVEGNLATLWIRGDPNPIVRRLASAEIEQLVFPEAELEDIFLKYYGRRANDDA